MPPAVDIVDSTWFSAPAAAVGAALDRPQHWPRWWPGLDLQVVERRRAQGMRWSVPRVRTGPAAGLAGDAEVWLEPAFDGVVGHFFLRLDPADGATPAPRTVTTVQRHYRMLTKRAFWAVADELDPGRLDRLTAAPR